jgi:argininosuccinate lyase
MARRLWDKGDALHPEVLAYTVGDDPVLDLELVEEDVWGSLAHSRMLADVGLLGDADRKAIHAGLVQVLAEHRRGAFRISAEEEDVHTAVEGRLTERAGEAGRRVHTGRSRNDQVLLDVRLFLRRRLLEVALAGLGVARALLDVAREHEAVVMPGYTHMRQAMPSSVGLWAAGHAEGIEESVVALLDAHRAADACPLGSAAGFGVPLPLDRRRTAALLGFARLQVNAQAVQSSRGKAEAQALFAATLLGNDLAKLAWDLQLASGPEHGFFKLAPDTATGSSIMPNKRNPDVLELTRANAAVVHSHLERVLLVASRLPSSYHRDYQVLKEPVIKGLRLARQMARAMELTVSGLEVDRARCEAAVATDAFATHRAFELCREGVAFRDAYRQVGAELNRGELARPTDLQAIRTAYATEGSPGDLRLAEAAARLDALSTQAEAARAAFAARAAALEAGEGPP